MTEFFRKPKILAVDDKPANLLALEVLLEAQHRVYSVTSGPAALEFLRRDPNIDVIILDVQMPGMDGFETAAEIKKLDACREIPIVFVTAVYQDDPHVKKGYAAGGIDYFGKPFDPEVLKLKIAIYASFRQRADILRQRERHIRESEELLRVGRKLSAVLESLPVGVLIADVEGRIRQTTEEVSRIVKSVEPAQADAYGEILGWWDSSGKLLRQENGPFSRALKGETSHSEALEIRCFGGETKAIVVSAFPLRGLEGSIMGAVVLIRDITESRRIESDLEARIARLINLGVELEESAAR
jgi:CheY-like chemotaxis protein